MSRGHLPHAWPRRAYALCGCQRAFPHCTKALWGGRCAPRGIWVGASWSPPQRRSHPPALLGVPGRVVSHAGGEEVSLY